MPFPDHREVIGVEVVPLDILVEKTCSSHFLQILFSTYRVTRKQIVNRSWLSGSQRAARENRSITYRRVMSCHVDYDSVCESIATHDSCHRLHRDSWQCMRETKP